jgi:hypothetical protein
VCTEYDIVPKLRNMPHYFMAWKNVAAVFDIRYFLSIHAVEYFFLQREVVYCVQVCHNDGSCAACISLYAFW